MIRWNLFNFLYRHELLLTATEARIYYEPVKGIKVIKEIGKRYPIRTYFVFNFARACNG